MVDAAKRRVEETRKLQVTGGSTFILSMPKQWVTQNHLKKGSALLVRQEDDGTISVAPSETGDPEKQDEGIIRISASEQPDAVTRKIVAAYLVGYNILNVKAIVQQQLSSRLRNHLKTFARRFLVGTEIVTDTPTELTLQVLLNYSELSVQSALRRMAIITSSMHKEATTSLKKLDHAAAKAVMETDSEVDRFNLYIIRLLKLAISNPRILKDAGLKSTKNCLGYRLITKSVERTADHATKIAENVLLLRKRVDLSLVEKIEKMSHLAISMFEDAIEALFKGDFNLAETDRTDKSNRKVGERSSGIIS